jgi:hypothetical protein
MRPGSETCVNLREMQTDAKEGGDMCSVYCNMYFCGILGFHVVCDSFYTRVGYRH